jgi:hypothetical protein
MDSHEQWKSWFHGWPAEMPPQGVVVTTLGEQIPFQGFLVSDHAVLLQRRTPDAVGARQVILPYGKIDSLKITDVVSPSVFTAAGFQGALPKT